MKPVWAVSACLLGSRCRYDGGHCYSKAVEKLKRKAVVVPVCPELLGGLGVPRTPCEIAGGTGADVWKGAAQVISKSGEDRTLAFKDGAAKALRICRDHGVTNALVKGNSPSCGYGTIYDGSFTGACRKGNGIFAECLLSAGIDVCNSDTV